MLARIEPLTKLVNEILEQLPQKYWIDPTTTFLDPAMGGGQFVAEIEKKLKEYGHSNENIAGRVFGYENNQALVDLAVNYNRLRGIDMVGNYSRFQYNSYLKQESNMKFDVIIGNPPYGKDSKAKRWTLWEEFVRKSITLADTVAMVVPQSLTSPGNTWGLVKEHCTVINVDVSKHFNVGSTFCYFIATPNQDQTTTEIITGDARYNLDMHKLPFLPININTVTIAQIDQLMLRPKRKWKRGELHTSNKKLFDENGRYTVMHTNAQILRTNVEHKNLNKIRVGVSLSGYPKFQVITHGYMSQACFWTEFDNIADANIFANECNDKPIQDLLANFKWSGWNSKEVIECL